MQVAFKKEEEPTASLLDRLEYPRFHSKAKS